MVDHFAVAVNNFLYEFIQYYCTYLYKKLHHRRLSSALRPVPCTLHLTAIRNPNPQIFNLQSKICNPTLTSDLRRLTSACPLPAAKEGWGFSHFLA
jgi:hypothetical protein